LNLQPNKQIYLKVPQKKARELFGEILKTKRTTQSLKLDPQVRRVHPHNNQDVVFFDVVFLVKVVLTQYFCSLR